MASLLSTNDTIWQVHMDLPCSPLLHQACNVPRLYNIDTGAAALAVQMASRYQVHGAMTVSVVAKSRLSTLKPLSIITPGFQPCLLRPPPSNFSPVHMGVIDQRQA